ncbi:hypothetical protein PROFUN_08772 [Planoprotostelium fungivorum]|uniref:Uncharacterized protein n=2 Tax=Planoprotostelium fungivorum TaxID=1890364 RepID=A0A2P6MVN6_9EUKA|nr:hypothetical protein PROFUN_08772 [Planoprotostelium fungivorum]
MAQASITPFQAFKNALTQPWDKIKTAKTEAERTDIIKEVLPQVTALNLRSILSDWESDTPLPTQTAQGAAGSSSHSGGPGAMELIKKSVFYFSENGSPIGVGFCVENQDTAVSAAHLWEIYNKVILNHTGYFAPPYDGETIELRVDAVDFRLDVIKFRVVRRSSTATEAFLPVHRRVLEFGTRCVLVVFQIGMEREMKDINPNTTMGIVEDSVGKVIGIHVESISQWRARTAVDRSDPNFEDDLCDSIDSLSAGLAYGAIALRLQNII